MCVYLGTKFQVSSIILKSFRHGVVILPPSPLPTAPEPPDEPLKGPPRSGLKYFQDQNVQF